VTSALSRLDANSHLDDELDGISERDVVLVVLLQDVLRALVVGANGCGLPPTSQQDAFAECQQSMVIRA
jgi:hypothetical protein